MAPGIGNDAVGAVVVTAVLDLQKRSGAALKAPGREDLKGNAPLIGRHLHGGPAVLCRLLQQRQKLLSVPGAEHHIGAQIGRRLRGGLGETAADADDGLRRPAPGGPDHLPGFPVALSGDGAGVDDVDIRRLRKCGEPMSPGHDHLFHGLGVKLIGLAAKGIKRESHRDTPDKALPWQGRQQLYNKPIII